MQIKKGMVVEMDKYIGKRLGGRYDIKELIGVGGMANVYKGHDTQTGRTVAIKVLREELRRTDCYTDTRASDTGIFMSGGTAWRERASELHRSSIRL